MDLKSWADLDDFCLSFWSHHLAEAGWLGRGCPVLVKILSKQSAGVAQHPGNVMTPHELVKEHGDVLVVLAAPDDVIPLLQ